MEGTFSMNDGFRSNRRKMPSAVSDYAQDKIFDQISTIFSQIQGRISHDVLNRALGIAQKLDRAKDYSREIEALKKAIEINHPYLQFFDILAKKNPQCRKKLIRNFLINAAFNGNKKRKDFSFTHNTPRPFFFVISPSMKCNLHCVGCYAGNYRRDEGLSYQVIDRILNDAKTMGIYFITVSGGEPFYREDILDLFAEHDDMYFQVFTNGTLIDAELAEKIGRIGNIAPVISCEGFEGETDHRRGNGTFRKICLAMDNLREAGVIFGFSTVPASYNYATLLKDAYYEFLVKKGVLFGWLFQYIPIGSRPDPGLMLTPEQRVTLHDRVKEARNRLPLFIADFWNDGPYVDGCLAAGRSSRGYFHINSNGDIEPCVFVHFAAGNIKDIYKEGGSLWDGLNSAFFKEIRAGQPWNDNHQMPCMIIDNPHCLRNVVRKTRPYPTHEGAESIIRYPALVKHLDQYSEKLADLLRERDSLCRPIEASQCELPEEAQASSH